jgi:CRISPR/Cas system-associated endonuclease Cas1
LRACRDRIQLYKQRLENLSKEKEKNHRRLQIRKKLNSFSTSDNMDKLLKYESSLERQFYKAISQLERLQRQRQGDPVPPPVQVDVNIESSHDRGFN